MPGTNRADQGFVWLLPAILVLGCAVGTEDAGGLGASSGLPGDGGASSGDDGADETGGTSAGGTSEGGADGTGSSGENSDGSTGGGTADGSTTGTDPGTTASDGSSSSEPDPVCGNGVAEDQELCDGNDLGGNSCETEGYSLGTLACNPDCTLDLSGCTNCGDDGVDVGEECDGADLGGEDCVSQGYPNGGTLGCTAECLFDVSQCVGSTCGDGTADPGEDCDCGAAGSPCTAAQLSDTDCTDLDSPAGTPYHGGTLACQTPTSCTFDTSACQYCGDGTINGTESCDGADLGGQSCTGLGYPGGGTLTCTSSCVYDVSGCAQGGVCGDGTCDAGEDSCGCPSDCPDNLNTCSWCECGYSGGYCYCDSLCVSMGDCCDLGNAANNQSPGLPGTACYECGYCY